MLKLIFACYIIALTFDSTASQQIPLKLSSICKSQINCMGGFVKRNLVTNFNRKKQGYLTVARLYSSQNQHPFQSNSRSAVSSKKSLLSLKGISKSFGEKTVLDGIDLVLNRYDRIVLVGENGSGKSTLFRILTGQLDSDCGDFNVNGTAGYLPQSFDHQNSSCEKKTIRQHLVELSKIEDLQPLVEGDNYIPDDEDWQRDFNSYGGYTYFQRLSELGLKDLNLERNYCELSGGEKVKIALVALAVLQPDLLLLDEPTNHLDLHAMRWLDNFLKSYQGAWIAISHDRTLINNSANKILELSPETHRLESFGGGYENYLLEKEKEFQRRKTLFEQNRDNISALTSKLKATQQTHQVAHRTSKRSDNDKISYNFRGAGKGKSNRRVTNQLHNKITALANEQIEAPIRRNVISFQFNESRPLNSDAIVINNLNFSLEQKPLLSNFSINLKAGERLIITGSNGCGKSTLLKLIAGKLTAIDGEIILAHNAIVGYLDQEQESLDPDLTPVEYCLTASNCGTTKEQIYSALKKMGLFDQLDLTQRISNLSVGRQRKVQLAEVLLRQPNILLLDEPTNHIDLASVEGIENQLALFSGTIIAVSHDRRFIDKIGTRRINLDKEKDSNNKSE